MKPIQSLPKEKIRSVFSDLDDTLTSEGRIQPETFRALCRLKEKDIGVTIVSGRPAGWADALMRLWPIDSMIFENGAGLMTRNGKKIITTCLAPSPNRNRLQEIFDGLHKEIPTLKLASDQPFRRFDFAIDYAEEPPFLSDSDVRHVMAQLKKLSNITAKLSSIHVNYWCGSHTKVTAIEYLLKGLSKDSVLFCGDSPNDEPLFDYFNFSVGVANVSRFLSQMKTPPKFVTELPSGKGFQQIVEYLLSEQS